MDDDPLAKMMKTAMEHIRSLPIEQQPHALLRVTAVLLKRMKPEDISEVRAEIAVRYPEHEVKCECGGCAIYQTSILDLIDGHLAMRELTGGDTLDKS